MKIRTFLVISTLDEQYWMVMVFHRSRLVFHGSMLVLIGFQGLRLFFSGVKVYGHPQFQVGSYGSRPVVMFFLWFYGYGFYGFSRFLVRFSWLQVGFYGFSWFQFDFYGFSLVQVDFYGFSWFQVGFHDFSWFHGKQLKKIEEKNEKF